MPVTNKKELYAFFKRRIVRFLSKRWGIVEWAIITLVLLLMGGYATFVQPPSAFPVGITVVIPQGETARKIATTLTEKHIITSPALFKVLVRTTGGKSGVQAGTYRFNEPLGLFSVTYRLLRGQLGIAPLHITLSEGMTTLEMGNTLAVRFPNISSTGFHSAAKQYEGYLFPDTYSFLPSVTIQTVISTMRKNFYTHISSINPQIIASKHSLKDIVVMASLLEREARTLKEKRMISGILWNRINKNMPLQVDAVFGYIFGKPTFSPSFADLKVKSSYNTYIHRGLPPGPISNPGLDSLLAAATPTKTAYLYYLTGTNGKMYYSKTLAEHNAHSVRYLHR